jgi:hypothetical protein
MRFMEVIKSAPPPAPGHGRAYRIEIDGGRPSALAGGVWNRLPCPQEDEPLPGQPNPDLWYKNVGWRHGCHEHTFQTWWPEDRHAYVTRNGGYLVVLDIPLDKMIALNMQVVFDMDAAKIVASTKEH